MATIKIKEVELPVVPPKGWAAAVAKAAGVSKKDGVQCVAARAERPAVQPGAGDL